MPGRPLTLRLKKSLEMRIALFAERERAAGRDVTDQDAIRTLLARALDAEGIEPVEEPRTKSRTKKKRDS